MTGGGAFAAIQGTVGWDNQPNEEEVHDVEDGETPNNLLGSSWNFLCRVGSLGSSQSSELSASICERGRNENGTEAVEAVEECRPRLMPILTLLLAFAS